MITVKISRAWCDEDMQDCYFAYNENTGETEHLPSYSDKAHELISQGFYYAGHRNGMFTYRLAKSAPLALPLDWQMAMETQTETVDQYQDVDF